MSKGKSLALQALHMWWVVGGGGGGGGGGLGAPGG